MTNYILKENCLTDDKLFLPSEGMIFKGGYIAILKIYTYQNEWSDKESIKKFKSETAFQKFLSKNYPNFKF